MNIFKRNWPHYVAEAAGLGFFMVCASAYTTVLRWPHSPLQQWIKEPFAQLVALGVPMGFVIAAVVYSPWGKKSGAHINPSVTIAFWRLGKISTTDALFYIAFQFLGGALAVQLMGVLLGTAYRDESIKHVMTKAGAGGPTAAFVAEFAISFILMLVILLAIANKKWEKFTGAVAGVLIALYLMFEEPYSGMSLNPARSFASAFAARDGKDLWIYFVAPTLAMLLAAQVFLWMGQKADDLPQHPMQKNEEQEAAREENQTPAVAPATA